MEAVLWLIKRVYFILTHLVDDEDPSVDTNVKGQNFLAASDVLSDHKQMFKIRKVEVVPTGMKKSASLPF